MSTSSFVNGLIAGAGIALAVMSVGFLYYIAPIENQQGISSTEIRVAIMLGGIVAAVSIGYEYYLNKNSKSTKQDPNKKAESDKAAQEAEDAIKAAEEAETAAKEAIAKADKSNSNKESQQVDSIAESQEIDTKDETR